MYTTTRDLAKAGQGMLSSKLLSAAQTRRWLQPVTSTSNLKNSVGRPWEIYHAGAYLNSSVLDIYAKSGELENFSSYFGLSPDFGIGFAILAYDTVSNPDLNVYEDIVSIAIGGIMEVAFQESKALFAGRYEMTSDSSAVINVTESRIEQDAGLVVSSLVINGTDARASIAQEAGIEPQNLDLRLYPSNIESKSTNGSRKVFIPVFQDIAASVDEGTPTCISWMTVGEYAPNVVDQVIFELDQKGNATALVISPNGVRLPRR